MGLCFVTLKSGGKKRMRVYKDEEMRWSMLRYDSRTFTAQQAKMLKGDVTRKEIPEKYIYIDDGCFRADGRMREVILHQIVRSLDGKPFSSARSERKLFFLRQ